ncbi:transglycosylase [Brevundimonas sp. Leaf363]|uniref:lytic transglycosylase domain-containing protein n=1 Tax=Brevundimonas sp. Leaf363 TaxID=1736353 RepID=UPI0007004DE6|nr:lytic transglycosylase domain-containing protein [Brevundimonas sp. Leaf363]KQS55547.1 transglycosylase [Brevundimonas sp. Leaf363]
MVLFRRANLALTLGLVSALMLGAPAGARAMEAPTALSSADRINYTTAFDALRRGDLETARAAARAAHDRVLLGQVEFERMFHADYSVTYDELVAWLNDYADMPCAGRVYNLALRRQPDGAAPPPRPVTLISRTWNIVSPGGGADPEDPAKQARIAYNNDDLTDAVDKGRDSGDWWTVGLATWRLNQFQASLEAFDRVADDPTQDAWVRAGAGVWAARAALRVGHQDRVTPYLQQAAQWPATFYGQIALRQLGIEPTIQNQGPTPYQPGGLQRASFTADSNTEAGVDARQLEAFVQSDARAKRSVAFFEVGRRQDAEAELRTGIRTATEGNARRLWTALARALGPRTPGGAEAATIDATRYPTPVLEPEGGFTIERALVYAIARKETGFNASARSGVGAYGMMQVMPGTAAQMTGDRDFIAHPERLFQPATNLRLGQVYVNRVLQMPALQGDLLRAVASYNAGPGPMVAAVRKLGPDADPLLLIETIDVPQARDYVEKVVAAYWIYQRMFGGPLNTLDAVASGATAIPISLDYVAPPPAPVQPASMEVAAVAPPVGTR